METMDSTLILENKENWQRRHPLANIINTYIEGDEESTNKIL